MKVTRLQVLRMDIRELESIVEAILLRRRPGEIKQHSGSPRNR